MIDYILLASLWLLILSQFYRVIQFRLYIEKNKILIAEMKAKNKELKEIEIRLQRLEEVSE